MVIDFCTDWKPMYDFLLTITCDLETTDTDRQIAYRTFQCSCSCSFGLKTIVSLNPVTSRLCILVYKSTWTFRAKYSALYVITGGEGSVQRWKDEIWYAECGVAEWLRTACVGQSAFPIAVAALEWSAGGQFSWTSRPALGSAGAQPEYWPCLLPITPTCVCLFVCCGLPWYSRHQYDLTNLLRRNACTWSYLWRSAEDNDSRPSLHDIKL